jgi:hypothetical protein
VGCICISVKLLYKRPLHQVAVGYRYYPGYAELLFFNSTP